MCFSAKLQPAPDPEHPYPAPRPRPSHASHVGGTHGPAATHASPLQVVPISLAFPRRWVEAHTAGPWPAEGQRRGWCLPPGPGEANPMAALARCDVLALDAEGDAERFLLQAYAAGVVRPGWGQSQHGGIVFAQTTGT